MRTPHWRSGEQYIPWLEKAVEAVKTWRLLVELPPSTEHSDAYEADVEFVGDDPELARHESVLLRGHQEAGGQIFVTLFLGTTVLRRGHIGGNHQEPDGGQLIDGPHIHYPTSVFSNIGSRRARSRAYRWSVPDDVSLRQAIMLFAAEVNIFGQPEEQTRLLGGS
jgi:hypothetical protein